MATVAMPYYRKKMICEIDDKRLVGVFEPKPYPEAGDQTAEVLSAVQNPVEGPSLSEKVAGAKRVLLITSDHTRPMPSKITIPVLLSEIRKGAPEAEIKILIATGFHRATTKEEIEERFGKEVAEQEQIIVHDARNAEMTYKGVMPSGGELWVNALADWADFILSEGFIEPHFFAGFSGGRKSILPGIASQKTVFYNHNSEFINSTEARAGKLAKNPIHADMAFAAKAVGLSFIMNVVLNSKKEIVKAFAGDPVIAHQAGCEFVKEHSEISVKESDIVVTSNGGFPLDLNIYQSVKSMYGAEDCVRKGGVIIAINSCYDGHGSEGFQKLFLEHKTPQAVEKAILSQKRGETMADQWQAQILARIMQKATVILVTDMCPKEMVEGFGLKYAKSFEQAMEIADEIVGEEGKVAFLPNGVEIICS